MAQAPYLFLVVGVGAVALAAAQSSRGSRATRSRAYKQKKFNEHMYHVEFGKKPLDELRREYMAAIRALDASKKEKEDAIRQVDSLTQGDLVEQLDPEGKWARQEHEHLVWSIPTTVEKWRRLSSSSPGKPLSGEPTATRRINAEWERQMKEYEHEFGADFLRQSGVDETLRERCVRNQVRRWRAARINNGDVNFHGAFDMTDHD